MLRKIIIAVLGLVGGIALLFASFLLYMTVTDTNPPQKTILPVRHQVGKTLQAGTPFSVITFNIGYCGLDKGQDFFMDGGKMSRSRSKAQTLENLTGITAFLAGRQEDLILLQEVDVRSSRSYKVNELAYLTGHLPGYSVVYGENYRVAWVPVPLTHPMGSVRSGLATFSRYKSGAAARYQYPGREKWPRQMFDLDRCFIAERIPVANGKELLLINSHLSAFDKGGTVRKQQMAYLKAFINAEYGRGNYVIVGGDWNHVMPGTDPYAFPSKQGWPGFLRYLPKDFTPAGFTWGADKTIPSIRTNGKPYTPGENFLAVIDGFLVSPNVKIVRVNGIDLAFTHSDHNPVEAVFSLQ